MDSFQGWRRGRRSFDDVDPEEVACRASQADPELGFLGYEGGMKVMVQYWKSFGHLESYSRSQDREHLSAWRAFNKRMAKARGDVAVSSTR